MDDTYLPVISGGFVGLYRFRGDPEELIAGHRRLLDGMPSGTVDLHLAIATTDGLVVIDRCPDEATFRGFSTNEDVLGAMEAAGLPRPEVEPLGEVKVVLAKPAG